MDTPDQPVAQHAAIPEAPEAHVNEVPIVTDDGLEWIALSGDAPPPPAQRPTEPAQGGADRPPDTFADYLGIGDRPAPLPAEPPASRSAQVPATPAPVDKPILSYVFEGGEGHVVDPRVDRSPHGKVPVVAIGGVERIDLGLSSVQQSAATPPPEPPPSRSAQVTAAMAKVRTEQRRSLARRTPYGYRLGHANGPCENRKRKLNANGRKSTKPDRRPLVENPREMEILDAIIAGFRKHADLPLGKAAHQVAKALRCHEVPNPRGTAPWHSGSIKSIYKTAMAHRQKQQGHREPDK